MNFLKKTVESYGGITILLAVASFLYLYKITVWQYFSYDQARDFLIIKEIITNHKLTLIGPSLGIADGLYLPPLYYYLLIIPLWVANFNLWGPDVFQAIIGVLSVYVFYVLCRQYFSKNISLTTSLLYVINPYLVQASRHIRNPNFVPLFVMLMVICFIKYQRTSKRSYLFGVTFFLGIALCMHIVVIVFLPIVLWCYYVEIKKNRNIRVIILPLILVFLLFSPLIIFDFRHDHGLFKALQNMMNSSNNYGLTGDIIDKTVRFGTFLYKLPIILLSGTFQKELLALRSFPITTVEQVNLFGVNSFELVKIVLAGALWLSAITLAIKKIFMKNRDYSLIFLLFILGLAISFLVPISYSYIYYFYAIFPFVLLLVAGLLTYIVSIKSRLIIVICSIGVLLAVLLPLLPNGLTTETRPQKYFIPTAEIIASDNKTNSKIVLVANKNSSLGWEKNAIEYRYFLETHYHLPTIGDKLVDYQIADVLYLIDEGDLADPLALKGMEMETFSPEHIVNIWTTLPGQKIYKLVK